MNSFIVTVAVKGKYTLTQIGIHLFLGAALWGTWMRYRTSTILGLPWMLFQLLASFPSLTPGQLGTQSPSCHVQSEPMGGEAGSARRNLTVRVSGQGSSSSLSHAMKHQRLLGGRERPRGANPPCLWCFLYQRLIK